MGPACCFVQLSCLQKPSLRNDLLHPKWDGMVPTPPLCIPRDGIHLPTPQSFRKRIKASPRSCGRSFAATHNWGCPLNLCACVCVCVHKPVLFSFSHYK